MKRVLIALGGNVAEPHQTLPLAWHAVVDRLGLTQSVCSELVTSAPAEGASGGDFANAVGLGYTSLGPREVLDALHRVEDQFGRDREREGHHGARPLDLDLLEYGSMISTDLTLTLPHPRIQDRWFVLAPLLSIVPDWSHLLSGRSGQELLAAVDIEQRAEQDL
ncbi:MAG TPA: 2-amino-4-hydroxy-6-hydroxymethyldihydropteridine diphosphokinase [Myxococcales bacterium]|nr:2-amino-4-hydroxy-6-hydroxymethyldihydropteridine diphosphokinase [Myxococcales bacterium]HAN30525.1 2-amino-4-hydroxy-6-hydroxymethyldihydropteridine diphosphokinase [Myxococcales bacterium]